MLAIQMKGVLWYDITDIDSDSSLFTNQEILQQTDEPRDLTSLNLHDTSQPTGSPTKKPEVLLERTI